ncbi:MAG: glycerol-3-phosphate 1-O-acyltransferase PlsY [Desulfurella sp.]|uniref:glycerol-3-phosphate 1-O-acyltransferase PlsY n=1 Tax=Desulfurella sp. TaxID=1962857 RepID=UPI003C9BB5CF
MSVIVIILISIVSFILGSIPSGYLIGKIKGVDIRKIGSGNIGASNAFRVLGKKEGAITLLLDMLKGLVIVAIVWFIFKKSIYAEISAVFAVLGHDFSLFLKFKGGKGVATTYGVCLLFSPYAFIGIALWLIILKITRYASLASLLSFGIALTIILFVNTNTNVKFLFITLFLLMLARHYSNIVRLLQGKEHKINEKKQ